MAQACGATPRSFMSHTSQRPLALYGGPPAADKTDPLRDRRRPLPNESKHPDWCQSGCRKGRRPGVSSARRRAAASPGEASVTCSPGHAPKIVHAGGGWRQVHPFASCAGRLQRRSPDVNRYGRPWDVPPTTSSIISMNPRRPGPLRPAGGPATDIGDRHFLPSVRTAVQSRPAWRLRWSTAIALG